MNRLIAFWEQHKPGLRLPESLALLLLASTSAFYLSVVQPAEERLRLLDDTVAKHKSASALLTVSHRGTPTAPAEKLRAFYAFFDRGNTFADWLALLYAVADRTGVELRQGEYRRVDPVDVPLVLQEVTLPITGDYTRIRALAEGVLATVPTATLDQVSLRRQRTNENVIEAELKFTFYLPRTKP